MVTTCMHLQTWDCPEGTQTWIMALQAHHKAWYLAILSSRNNTSPQLNSGRVIHLRMPLVLSISRCKLEVTHLHSYMFCILIGADHLHISSLVNSFYSLRGHKLIKLARNMRSNGEACSLVHAFLGTHAHVHLDMPLQAWKSHVCICVSSLVAQKVNRPLVWYLWKENLIGIVKM